MNKSAVNINEEQVSNAFSKQSPVFDEIDDANKLIIWMRDKFRNEVLEQAKPNDKFLELNCGTGIDSVFFAKNGFQVHSTDNAEGMLTVLNDKIKKANLSEYITTERSSFNEIGSIEKKNFDYVISNFGGLNCTDKLHEVLDGIDLKLKTGGIFTLVIMPKVCPWEIVMLFKGMFKTAFRRFKKKGTKARVEGVYFDCYYYNPSYITKHLKDKYDVVTVQGLGIFVPPPFIEQFIEKHPKLFRFLEKIENRVANKYPFNKWCDHYMITMRKK